MARLKIAQKVHDLGLDRHIERTGRFVEDDQPGFEHKGAGDGDALALAARKLMGVALRRIRVEADLGQGLPYEVLAFFPGGGKGVDLKTLAHDLAYRKTRA